MFPKISITTTIPRIESFLEAQFEYPHLFDPRPLIDGRNEENLFILTQHHSQIKPAIWGLLPENYEGDWDRFQHSINTLNIAPESIEHNLMYRHSIAHRRCIIISTGFFTSYLKSGQIYPYLVYSPNNQLVCYAGTFNELADGFLSCAILLSPKSSFISKIHNVDNYMPKILDAPMRKKWLDPNLNAYEIYSIVTDNSSPRLKAHPIAMELFHHNISYDSMLEPKYYEGIPVID